ncbi:MAG: class I SAM-dependent methyltransferase [Bacteroidetes bacterium]|nr:class I SAM-dependent methyltransferase [Bacteroidota bacterium]
MKLENHTIYQELLHLNIVSPDSIKPFYPKVRDRDDVGVLRCEKSGVIFLNRTDHVASTYYSEKEGTSYWSSEDRNAGLKETAEDDKRRAKQIEEFVKGKVYADVGAGLGGILDLMKPFAKEILAVEPQRDIRENLKHLGYNVLASIDEIASSEKKVDFITLFHVFEHITDPLASLKQLNKALAPRGKIFIEVPHAGDVLITTYNLDSFKKFTFWSEHLILHTKKSLHKYLEAAGFKNISVKGFQRYPLTNHLLWLRDGKPGGQNFYRQLREENSEKAYAEMLDRNNLSDTIIAIAEK